MRKTTDRSQASAARRRRGSLRSSPAEPFAARTVQRRYRFEPKAKPWLRSATSPSATSRPLAHPYTNLAALRETGPLVIERGQGVFVYDSDGKAYIEGMAGLWCTALGYGNEELVEAAAAQMRKLPFSHLFTGKSHDPAIELAETAQGDRAGPDLEGVLLLVRARRRTTPRSSSSGT